MKNLIRLLLWYCYYLYDFNKCRSTFQSTRFIDDSLSKKLFEFLIERKHSSIVIFACYEKNIHDEYLKFIFSNLKEAVVVVVNNTNKNNYKIELVSANIYWIDRPNFLRDIGAYRLAIKALSNCKLEDNVKISLLNDSVFILKKSFFEFFYVDSESPVLCHSFSRFPYPHARSYCIRFLAGSINLLNNYLQTIDPVRSRYAAVKFGEIGMSKNIFLKQKISLWASLRRTGGIIESRDHYKISLENLFNYKLKKELSNDLVKDSLLDPYELSDISIWSFPDLIKRESLQKRYIKKTEIIRWVTESDLPDLAKTLVLDTFLIDKNHKNIFIKVKERIGEV